MEESKSKDGTAQNAIKLLGEAVLPGASLLMDGRIVEGGAHWLAGMAAGAVLGPIGLAVVIANSYSRSTVGKHLVNHFVKASPKAEPALEKRETP
jgi:hypothetical protein